MATPRQLQLTEYPTSNQERELLGTATFTDLATARDIRTDNLGTFDAWAQANRDEWIIDLPRMTPAEALEVQCWIQHTYREYHASTL